MTKQTEATMPVTPAKRSKRVKSQVRTVKPRQQRIYATTVCSCGCGESFTPDRITQRFVRGHRFAAYTNHECPDCGSVHRKRVTQ